MPDINGIPYVDSTDLVSAYPTVSQALAQEVSDQLASKLDLAGGKILQIVRATDSTARTTTSTSYADVTGMAVTITPKKSDSAVLLIAHYVAITGGTSSGIEAIGDLIITDSSNNSISGAQNGRVQITAVGATFVIAAHTVTQMAYATPATTSAVTYKMRFKTRDVNDPLTLANNDNTGQMYAIEVSA